MDWIVFDYGDVISRHTTALPELAAMAGTGPDAFTAAYWAEREAYDRGLSHVDYWRAVGARVGVDVDGELADALTERDVLGWLDTDPDTVELLDQLRAAGTRLALLSNAPAAFGRAVERQPWSGYFEHLVFSADLGTAKPDAEIWAALTARLGTQPGGCLFFDDRQVNVDGALAFGMNAQLWSTAAEARAHLTGHGLL